MTRPSAATIASAAAFRPRRPLRSYEAVHDALGLAVPLPVPGEARQNVVLTARRQQIGALLARGFSNKEIGAHLGLSVRTVENHREEIFRCLRLRGLARLTQYALAHGWISNEFTRAAIRLVMVFALFFSAASLPAATFAVRLTWQDNADNETGFILQRATSEGAFATVSASIPANSTAFIDVGQPAGAQLSYRILAFNDAGQSAWSPASTITLKSGARPPAVPGAIEFDEPILEAPPVPPARQEAEAARLTQAATIADDPAASGGRFVLMLVGGAKATFAVNVEVAGAYQIRARVLAENQQSDSYFVTVDTQRYAWNLPAAPGWAERTVALRDLPGPLTLTAGPHTITLEYREACRLDWIELVALP